MYGSVEIGIEIQQERGNLLVKLQGELDHHAAGKIREAVDREWEKDLAENIIFDLNYLKFMDSSGVGVIMGRYKQVVATGGKIVLCGLSSYIAKIIELSGLQKLVYIYEEVEDALQALDKESR